jgi:Uma2 family endonuclease
MGDRAKRAEYSVLDIPEYWICDTLKERVTVCTLLEGWYEAAECSGQGMIDTPMFSNLKLIANRFLQS